MVQLCVDDKCPCGSGRVPRECCLKAGGELRPMATVTRAPVPQTDIRNGGCYASGLADCSADISREHYISHALLRLLSVEGRVTIDGFPWQNAAAVSSVPPATLTGKILCSRHNSALSPLDAVAAMLFRRIDEFHHEIRDRKYENRFFLCNGHDIERWMLKTLCGAVVSGNAEMRSGQSNWRPPLEWVQILFGENRFQRVGGCTFTVRLAASPVSSVDLSSSRSPTRRLECMGRAYSSMMNALFSPCPHRPRT